VSEDLNPVAEFEKFAAPFGDNPATREWKKAGKKNYRL